MCKEERKRKGREGIKMRGFAMRDLGQKDSLGVNGGGEGGVAGDGCWG